MNPEPVSNLQIEQERDSLLTLLHDWLDAPMLVLAFVWLALFIVETLWGLSPVLEIMGYIIWGLFLFEFVLGFALAPRKRKYLRQNWLKALSLVAPAFRLLRIVRLVRLARLAGVSRGLRLLRVLSSLNRGMRALSASMGRRGFGYVVLFTLIVTLVSAAGMYAFENEAGDAPSFASYGEALWWTSMIMTTLGSDYWPHTAAGRILCFFLSLYAFAVFGYVTATLATYFVDSDAGNNDSEVASASQVAELRRDIAELRSELAQRANATEAQRPVK